MLKMNYFSTSCCVKLSLQPSNAQQIAVAAAAVDTFKPLKVYTAANFPSNREISHSSSSTDNFLPFALLNEAGALSAAASGLAVSSSLYCAARALIGTHTFASSVTCAHLL